MPSRWDHLFEAQKVPLVDHLLAEVARLVAADLGRWPLPITELDPAAAASFGPALQEGLPRPAPAVFQEAIRLTRWELERQSEAYDDYIRNRRYLERGLSPQDKPALLFISRWLLEQLLALSESTEGRVNRGRLLQCLELIERKAAAPG